MEKLTPFYEIYKCTQIGRYYVDMNIQQICKISRKNT